MMIEIRVCELRIKIGRLDSKIRITEWDWGSKVGNRIRDWRLGLGMGYSILIGDRDWDWGLWIGGFGELGIRIGYLDLGLRLRIRIKD